MVFMSSKPLEELQMDIQHAQERSPYDTRARTLSPSPWWHGNAAAYAAAAQRNISGLLPKHWSFEEHKMAHS